MVLTRVLFEDIFHVEDGTKVSGALVGRPFAAFSEGRVSWRVWLPTQNESTCILFALTLDS